MVKPEDALEGMYVSLMATAISYILADLLFKLFLLVLNPANNPFTQGYFAIPSQNFLAVGIALFFGAIGYCSQRFALTCAICFVALLFSTAPIVWDGPGDYFWQIEPLIHFKFFAKFCTCLATFTGMCLWRRKIDARSKSEQ